MFSAGLCEPSEAPNCKGDAWHNYFEGVLCEPGPGSRYYHLDEFSAATTIIGHDNTPEPSVTHDPEFTYLTAGMLRLGDFSERDAPMDTAPIMQIEGFGYSERTH